MTPEALYEASELRQCIGRLPAHQQTWVRELVIELVREAIKGGPRPDQHEGDG